MGIGGYRIGRCGPLALWFGLMALLLAGCADAGRRSAGTPQIAALVPTAATAGSSAYPGFSFGWNPPHSGTTAKIGPPPLSDQDTYAVSPKVIPASDEDRRCFAANLYYEAGGEGEKGLIAVGHVVLNRLAERPPGTTLCAVIYERMQFSWTRNLRRHEIVLGETPRWQQSIALTDRILAGETSDPTDGATYFYSLISFRKHRPSWARSCVETVRIANHAFLR